MQAVMSRQVIASEFFVYSRGPLTFVERLDTIPIDTDADFELLRLSMWADDGGPITAETRRLPLVDLQIFDTANGRGVFAAPVPIAALFGDGTQPFILPTTHWFKRGSQAVLQTSGDEVDAVALWVNLIGRKRFERGPL